jgi:TM2 domain-containing membrane protein YozV
MRSTPSASSRSLRRSLSRRLGLGLGSRVPQEEPRTLAISYLLWGGAMFGVCGLQRFYNRRPLSGLLWLFTFGLCGLGQLADLLLIPDLVKQANQRALLEDALSALSDARGEAMGVPLERQLLLLARRVGSQGFTLNDALVDLQLPSSIDSAMVRAEIERMLQDELLDVGNDERGRVVYREP